MELLAYQAIDFKFASLSWILLEPSAVCPVYRERCCLRRLLPFQDLPPGVVEESDALRRNAKGLEYFGQDDVGARARERLA